MIWISSIGLHVILFLYIWSIYQKSVNIFYQYVMHFTHTCMHTHTENFTYMFLGVYGWVIFIQGILMDLDYLLHLSWFSLYHSFSWRVLSIRNIVYVVKEAKKELELLQLLFHLGHKSYV